MSEPPIMPFGKYKGWHLDDLPDDYLDWLLSLPNLRQPLLNQLKTEAHRRDGTTFDPPRIARQLPTLADVEELISAGQKTLAKKYHPDLQYGGRDGTTKMAALNHAADWLRICARDVLTPS